MATPDTKIDEVAGELHRRIDAGIYVVGQRLPSERELGDELGASRPTIHAALLRLQAENLIEILPRSGAFIRAESTRAHISPSRLASTTELQDAGSFMRFHQAHGRHPLVRLLHPAEIVPASKEVALKLDIAPTTPILSRSSLHLIDRVPYRLMDSYTQVGLIGNAEEARREDFSIVEWLREHTGVETYRIIEKLSCRMPTAEEANYLHMNRMQPVMELERQLLCADKEIIEYTRIIANGALHDFTYTYTLPE